MILNNETLKDIVRNSDLTMSEMATKSGVSRQVIYNLAKTGKLPTTANLLALLQVLGYEAKLNKKPLPLSEQIQQDLVFGEDYK